MGMNEPRRSSEGHYAGAKRANSDRFRRAATDPAKEVREVKIWIVVADEREALFYDVGASGETHGNQSGTPSSDSLFLALKITHPQARPDRGLESARSSGFAGGTDRRDRSDGGRSARRSDHEHFAARIGEEIDRARSDGRFDRLVLGAPPAMLALIRSKLTAASRALLAAEVAHPRAVEHEVLEELIPEIPLQPWFRPGAHR